jgi:hypothetical protein
MKFRDIRIFIAAMVAICFVNSQAQEVDELFETNNQIRRDKFDIVLPQAMRNNNIDMWIHVMREAIPDPFGTEELGSSSGVFIFTDRGGDRIERAILGRRWGAAQRQREVSDYKDPVADLGAYDIIGDPVRVQEPLSGPTTEYDLRFEGLKEFIEARNPERIAVNFKQELGQWPTYQRIKDGISHTDYVLLTEEIGNDYADRLVSSEYVMMDYILGKVPSEIDLLKRMRRADIDRVEKAFSEIVPGLTKVRENHITVFRRMSTGLSQRGRSRGWENSVIQGGDIVTDPDLGMYAYVLREGEAEPPPEIRKLWAEYLKIDRILAETIKAGLMPNEIINSYTRKFEDAGIIVRDDQLHMVLPKNEFPAYAAGFDAGKTHLTIDAHGQMKGAHERSDETYYAPRIGSYGPNWSKELPLPMNHHFVLEYFFYMPSPSSRGEDQYLFWWDHEQAIATESGVEYLSPPQKDLILIH